MICDDASGVIWPGQALRGLPKCIDERFQIPPLQPADRHLPLGAKCNAVGRKCLYDEMGFEITFVGSPSPGLFRDRACLLRSGNSEVSVGVTQPPEVLRHRSVH